MGVDLGLWEPNGVDMLKLLLFRHAKSSWSESGVKDFDRPLAPRGERAAPQMGRFIAERHLHPELVLCSAAQRTRQTLERALATMPCQPLVRYEHGLYLGGVSALLRAIREVDGGFSPLMVVGHNPDMCELAIELVDPETVDDRYALFGKFPTAALAVFSFARDRWRDVRPATGKLELYVTPKMLN